MKFVVKVTAKEWKGFLSKLRDYGFAPVAHRKVGVANWFCGQRLVGEEHIDGAKRARYIHVDVPDNCRESGA